MRPPIATSKNDATPALHNQRKTSLNQKGVLVDNKKKPNLQQTNNQEKQQTPVQATSLINSESDDFLCFKSQPAKFDEFLAKRNSSSSGGSDDINSSVTFFTSCQNYSENVNDTLLENPNSRNDKISKNPFDGLKVVPTPLPSSISSSAIKTSSNGITEFNWKCNLTSAEDVPKNLFVNNFEIFNRNYNDNVRVNGVTTDKVATVVSLPLSETAPLLTNIETTLADPKRSICLNKNSASLIFTKKDCNSATSLNNKNCNNTSNSFVQRLSSVTTNNNSSSVGAKCETKRNNNNNSRNSNVNNNNSNSNISNRNKNSNLKIQHRQSLQVNYFPIINRDSSNNTSNNCAPNRSSTASTNRRQHAYSWYAPVYSALEEEFEQESRDSSPIHKVAETQNSSVAGNEVLETSSLLNPSTNSTTIGQPQLHHPRIRRQTSNSSANQVVTQAKSNNNVNLTNQTQIVYNESEGPHATSLLGGPLPRRKRFENFLKSLVGRKPSKDPNTNTTLLPSPELKVSHSPSEHSLLRENHSGHDKITSSTVSLNSVQQKLWNVVPLLKREGSVTSLHHEKSNPLVQYSGLRKCETVLALSRSTVSVEPIKPQNRLRNSSSTSNANCSRCSSLLSLAASGSRYSLNLANSGFVTVNNATHGDNTSCQQQNKLSTVKTSTASICSTTTGGGVGVGLSGGGLTNTNGVSRFSGKCAANHENSSSANGEAVFNKSTSSSQQNLCQQSSSTTGTAITITASAVISSPCGEIFRCKLCLADVEIVVATTIEQCGCIFCTECMKSYVEFEISEGAYQISCPDAQCPHQGIVSLTEITSLASPASMKKYHRYRLNHEIELDKNRTWCPRAGCETICVVGPAPATSSSSSTEKINLVTQVLCSVQCPTCKEEFCSGCKKPWHPSITCEDNSRRLAAEGQYDFIGIPFDNDLIKYCPMCAVPIEKDEGCAQMMCKRCKHVFCWYCLASLDDDFLLRHYDKGPCKNKLGHSRASVVWHRAQVIGIFAGFGILLLVASPLLLLAAPCIICCKCRICNGSGRLDDPDTDFDDAVALQR